MKLYEIVIRYYEGRQTTRLGPWQNKEKALRELEENKEEVTDADGKLLPNVEDIYIRELNTKD